MADIIYPEVDQVWESLDGKTRVTNYRPRRDGWEVKEWHNGKPSDKLIRFMADESYEGYKLVECPHEERCCGHHDTHVQPHRGCLLR